MWLCDFCRKGLIPHNDQGRILGGFGPPGHQRDAKKEKWERERKREKEKEKEKERKRRKCREKEEKVKEVGDKKTKKN